MNPSQIPGCLGLAVLLTAIGCGQPAEPERPLGTIRYDLGSVHPDFIAIRFPAKSSESERRAVADRIADTICEAHDLNTVFLHQQPESYNLGVPQDEHRYSCVPRSIPERLQNADWLVVQPPHSHVEIGLQ